LRGLGVPFHATTLGTYRRINRALWARYARGELAGPFVARERFRQLLLDHGAPARHARVLGRTYLAHLSGRGDTLPGARAALLRLRRRFRIAAVTNGYDRVQRSRLAAARLTHRFDAIVTSEGCGFTKPHPGIVHAALEALRCRPSEAVYVGDDVATDGAAAKAAGVPFYWLDRGEPTAPGHALPRRRVASLAELADRLSC